MANKYWLGTTNDMAVVSNYSPAGIPGAGDNLIFDDRTLTAPEENTDALSAVALNNVTVRSTVNYDIGTLFEPLIVQPTNRIYLSGKQTTYLMLGEGDVECPETIINSGTVYLSSADNSITASIFDTVRVIAGTVYILGYSDKDSDPTSADGHPGESGTIIQNLFIYGGTVTVSNKCEDLKNDTKMSILIDGGTLNQHSSIEDLVQTGGQVNFGSTTYDQGVGTVQNPSVQSETDDDIDTIYISSGTFKWQPQSGGIISTNPRIGTLNIYGGRFDGTAMKESVDIDPKMDTIYQYSGSMDLRNTYANFDVGSFYYEGGGYNTAPGQEMSLEGGL